MYTEIEKLLDFLELESNKPLRNSGFISEEYFSIKPYGASNYRCEIAEVFSASMGALETFKKIYNNDYFELHHPFYNDILTRAVYSHRFSNNCHFIIFFVDEHNRHPWALVILTTMYCFITKEGIFSDCHFKDIFFIDWEKTWAENNIRNGIINVLRHIKVKNLCYKKQKFIPTLFTTRPWHFVTETLSLSIYFDLKHLYNENMFFKLSGVNFEENGDRIIIPVRLDHEHHRACFTNTKVKNCIVQEAFLNHFYLIEKDIEKSYDLVVWLGIPGERRYWLEQLDGIPNILKNLAKYFPKMKVYIDGMTAYEGVSLNVDDNKRVFFALKNKIDELNLCIDTISLAGCEYKTKITYASSCDIYIGDVGTTLMVPCLLLDKPGVLFSPDDIEFYRDVKFSMECNKKLLLMDFQYISSKKTGRHFHYNFSIPWQSFYNLSADVLEKIKNIKMHRLDVPPVELLVLRARVNALSTEINRLKAGNVNSLTATDRMQNHLSYKLGRLMIENSKSIFGWIKMPFSIISTIKEHKLLKKLTNKITKLPKIETLPDYKEALKYKNHMSYKLGEAFLKINKNWHKGGPIWFIFEAIKIIKSYKNKK